MQGSWLNLVFTVSNKFKFVNNEIVCCNYMTIKTVIETEFCLTPNRNSAKGKKISISQVTRDENNESLLPQKD